MRWRRRPPKLPTLEELTELVRRANPVDEASVEPPDASRVEAIVRAMTDPDVAEPDRARRRWRRRRLGVAGAIFVVAGGGAVAWAALHQRPAHEPLTVACHAGTHLDGPVVVVPASATTSPVELCMALWNDGALGGPPPPQLVACVGPGGAATVFPSDDTSDVCAELGLAPLDPEIPAEHAAEIRFQEALSQRLDDLGCIDAARLDAIATDELERTDLEWTVTTRGDPTPQSPCAVPNLDPTGNQVVIEFIPDIWSPVPTTATTTTEES